MQTFQQFVNTTKILLLNKKKSVYEKKCFMVFVIAGVIALATLNKSFQNIVLACLATGISDNVIIE